MGALDSIVDPVARDHIKRLDRIVFRLADRVLRDEIPLLVDWGASLPAKPNDPSQPMLFMKTVKPGEIYYWMPLSDGTWGWNGPINVMR